MASHSRYARTLHIVNHPCANVFSGGLRAEQESEFPRLITSDPLPNLTAANEPGGVVDDVLTYILLSIAVSGGDFKSDSHKWWSKATRLAFSLKMNREDERCPGPVSPCANPLCACKREQDPLTLQSVESREERRRVFWLLYSLDRHLSLSFNTVVSIPDSYCEVYCEYCLFPSFSKKKKKKKPLLMT